jgi:hypothetical protein
MSSSLDIVKNMMDLCEAGKFDEAAELLADDVKVAAPSGPMNGISSKAEWTTTVKKHHKSGPKWGTPREGDNDKQVVMDGTVKVLFVTMKVKRTIDVNDAGKIQTIVAAKA